MQLRLAGVGHDQIRATHAKTLELSTAASVTARATCVVAVGMAVDPAGASRLAGPVRITLHAGDQAFSLRAIANSGWDPAGGAVIRRSGLRLPGTLATDSDAAASDLPAPLVAALRSPGTPVEAIAERAARPDGRADVVLLWAEPGRGPDPRLAAEIEAADLVLAEDRPAAQLIADAGGRAGNPADTGKIVERRGRVLAVAAADLPGASVTGWLGDPSVTAVDVLGLPPPLAAAAASPSRGPLVVAAADDLPALLRGTPRTHRISVTVERGRLEPLLALAGELRGSRAAVIAQPCAAPLRVMDGALPGRLASGMVSCCLDALDCAAGDDPPGPGVDSAMAGLIGDGVSTRTAARALARLTGWSRQRAYDHLLRLRAGRP